MSGKLLGLGFSLACVFLLGSCKPKQSAYKSVYEAAKEKEMESDVTSAPVNKKKDVAGAVETGLDVVRKEKLTPVSDADAANLKAYNVVVAAMGMKPSAESLRERLGDEGYKVVLAKNEQGMFRVIIASCNTKEEAVQKKNQILSDFAAKSDFATLKNKFGIPFTDWWILHREY